MTQDILILGAGYSAQAFSRARPDGFSGSIQGTTRGEEKFNLLREAGIAPLVWAGGPPSPELKAALGAATHLMVSAAPDDDGDPALNRFGAEIAAAKNLRWIGYLSTVGVYGDHDGAWIDEEAELRPVSRRSKNRVVAESAWLALGARKGVPVAILRLSGIYGPGRNAFVNLERGTAKRLVKPGQVFNRIHAEDIAGGLWHLMGMEAGGAFNVSDDRPAPPQDVVTFAAELMGVPPPPEIPFETAELTPMQRSFYGENKRVSNAKLKGSGYRFRFPDHRAALTAMWRSAGWRGSEADRRSPITSG
ncbi:MAG TPA: SDR family NAD(P)-dependent oxidoreductase [Mesorhizobium sp.]|jgi:nucleoside-diphosphate-sugar epimerase|nr:SDR family NAD(P)-dependent oxidoreductase [Mesorhizobium sp.]